MIEIKKAEFGLVNTTPDESLALVNDLIDEVKAITAIRSSAANLPSLALLTAVKAKILLRGGCCPNNSQGTIT